VPEDCFVQVNRFVTEGTAVSLSRTRVIIRIIGGLGGAGQQGCGHKFGCGFRRKTCDYRQSRGQNTGFGRNVDGGCRCYKAGVTKDDFGLAAGLKSSGQLSALWTARSTRQSGCGSSERVVVEAANEQLHRFVAGNTDHHLPIRHIFGVGCIYKEVLEAAKKIDADLIVLGVNRLPAWAKCLADCAPRAGIGV